MTTRTTCPHCARVLRGKAVQQHICPEDPANRAVIIAALRHPGAPGVARSTTQYRAIAVASGAPDLSSMMGHFGSWTAVCQHFGLTPPVTTCPHCRRYMQDVTHPARCVAHPDLRPLILAALTDPADPARAVGPSAYELRAAGTGAPGQERLRNVFANWRQVAKFFGLSYRDRTDREAQAIAEVAAAVDEDRELQRELAGHGLEVCRVRSLPDGRVACMLR